MRTFLIALFPIVAIACGSSTTTPDGGGPCDPTGSGTLTVTVTGLPPQASTPVSIKGTGTDKSIGATETVTLAGGSYTITAAKVTTPDPIVRSVFSGTTSSGTVCVANGKTATVTVTYALVPSSNKLWMSNANGSAPVLGFASASLGTTATSPATVAATGPGGQALAFDTEGNLWSVGATTGDALLNRFAAGTLGTSGAKTPDRQINIPALQCLPRAAGIAFDKDDNLWMASSCDSKVFRVTAAQLAASGDVTPSVTVSGVKPIGIAFDKTGNLWVADTDNNRIRRFDAAHLAASTTTADLSIDANTPSTGSFSPSWLAFDKDGNLWANDFGANLIYKLTPTELAGTGDKSLDPSIKITIGVASLLEGMAFDDGGGLWTTLSSGKFARLAPSQLTTSSGSGSPTTPDRIITSGDVGSADKLAFYPAAAGLPLRAALP